METSCLAEPCQCRLRVKAGQRCSNSATWAGWKSWDFTFAPFIPLLSFICFLSKGNPCPLVQPPINGKIEPSQAKYTFKDQVVISCNTGYKVLKVWVDNMELGIWVEEEDTSSQSHYISGRVNTNHTSSSSPSQGQGKHLL